MWDGKETKNVKLYANFMSSFCHVACFLATTVTDLSQAFTLTFFVENH
jgi:hypothetical protein